jgi:hypothetical protein
MAKTTTANVRNRHGDLTVQHHETDSPLLPVAQLELLHQFKPDAVDFVISQTKIEADYRRATTSINTDFVFLGKLATLPHLNRACLFQSNYFVLSRHVPTGKFSTYRRWCYRCLQRDYAPLFWLLS